MENVIRSPYPDVLVPDQVTVPDVIISRCKQFGDDLALICAKTGKQLTFNQVVDLIERMVTGLAEMGMKQSDVLGACIFNSIEYIPLAMAVVSLGGIFTTSNPDYTEDEIVYHYTLCNVKFVVTNDDTVDKVLSLQKKCPSIKMVINIGTSKNNGTVNIEELLKKNNYENIARPKINTKHDAAFYLSSSGTTGLPKAVMLTHFNIVTNLCQLRPLQSKHGSFSMFTLKRNDRYISVFPYYHIGGLVYGGLLHMQMGACAIILPKFDTKLYLSTIEKFRPSMLLMPPPVLVFLTKSSSAAKLDCSSVKAVLCGAAPIGQELVDLTCKKFNLKHIVEGYGMTELSPMSHMVPVGDISARKQGSCGVPMPNSLCKVVDTETGKPVGPRKTGEICVKGTQVMKGYLNNPQATSNTIDKDGFVHTGDIGYYDEDSFFYIVDRIKDLIKVKGFQVAPAELENVLLSHDGIADVAVIGVPDEYAGEVPMAFVVNEPNFQLSEKDIKEYVAKRVIAYKRLEGGVKFVDFIPKTSSGKILRRFLRQQVKNEREKSKI